MKCLNIHLISDSTGETLGSVSRAVMSQFPNIESNDFTWSLVQSKEQFERIKKSIFDNPGIVLYTILQDDIIIDLQEYCKKLNVPCISVLSNIIFEFSKYLNIEASCAVGRQHNLNEEYFSRVNAINYTINHDDGQSISDLYDADIIIIGISRTSKSPTSVYLSCRGYKTANIPFVTIDRFPKEIYDVKKPFIIGLTINPEKLIHIRKNRVKSMGERSDTNYIDIKKIKQETIESRKLFAKLKCNIIDVTKRSVEETATKIIQLKDGSNIK